MNRRLSTRVLRAVLLILLLGGVLVGASTWMNGRQAARAAYDRILLGAANDIAESIRVQNGAPFVDMPVSALDLLAQAPDDRVHYTVLGPGGGFVTGMTGAPSVPVSGTLEPIFFEAQMQGEPARFVRVKRRFSERDFSGDVTVIVGQTLRARRAMALDLMTDALWPMLVAGVALLAIAWVVIRKAMRPLGALSDNLALRDPHDLTPMPTDGLPGELTVMLDALNRFMGRLDRQLDAMRNLISDTAHQLRTPVAAIRVQAEGLVEQSSNPPQERALGRLLTRTRSLGTLLDQLLSRALVIHRTDAAPRIAFDLREVALDIIERRDHELVAPGIDVRLEIGEDPVMVRADAFSVGEAARNLLSNALRHGEGPVVLGVGLSNDDAALWVQDAGPGPAPEIAAKLGQRFERSATSREDSAGLGLSIVAAVAAAFGGRVDMTHPQNGFRISLVLPAAKDKTL